MSNTPAHGAYTVVGFTSFRGGVHGHLVKCVVCGGKTAFIHEQATADRLRFECVKVAEGV